MMDTSVWWKDPKFTLGQIENEETHVTVLRGRVVEGVWEYAAVRYIHKLPTLLWAVREGVLEPEEPT